MIDVTCVMEFDFLEFQWRFYVLPVSKAIFRVRTQSYNCIQSGVCVMDVTCVIDVTCVS